jgi:hypothetical protein
MDDESPGRRGDLLLRKAPILYKQITSPHKAEIDPFIVSVIFSARKLSFIPRKSFFSARKINPRTGD